MIFGKNRSCFPLNMYGKELELVNDYKYFGVKVEAGDAINFSTLRPLIRFRCSANTILNAPCRSSENVFMKLLYAVCIPNLTYACEAVNYSSRQFHPLNVAVNDCIRRIFGRDRWESVRHLRQELGYLSLTEIFHKRTKKFLDCMHFLRNDTLNLLRSLHSED